ncbi:hypothetical protein SeLEV6574_g00679 [Synchytrium endobioticum]|uniref:Uncharacterized protein n=1 Tax=Synchytrium endobioticum TaxID=286115 RepID=A0A507DGW5_9FUNG|nr:hypothetical protein SeLEV6574_g00679 [Synchytrium endobioticum]
MTRLFLIYMVILIVVFVVHQIQAADKDDNQTLRQISERLSGLRKEHIRGLIRQRQAYVPAGSPLKLGQLSLNPDPGNSIMWQTYVMEYNAYQFELCHSYHVQASKILVDLASGGPRRKSFKRKKAALSKHSETLELLMRGYLLLEVKHAIVSDGVAPHIRMIVSTHGDDLALPINELRDERLSLAKCINAMNANIVLVSLENATDDLVLERKSPPPSMEDRPMAPTSHMLGAVLHYIMEYNGLMFMKYQFKSVQLKKVLNNALTPKESRPELENRQQQVLAEMKTYFYAACEYAEKLTDRALDSVGYVKDRPPLSDSMDVSGVGNDVYNSEGNAPAASSVSVQPEGPDELDFDADLRREDWDMVLPLLEEPDFNQHTIYEPLAGFAAGGGEETPHHLDYGLSQLNEAEVMWSAPVYRPIPNDDEASSSREGQSYSFGPSPGQGSTGITPDFIP